MSCAFFMLGAPFVAFFLWRERGRRKAYEDEMRRRSAHAQQLRDLGASIVEAQRQLAESEAMLLAMTPPKVTVRVRERTNVRTRAASSFARDRRWADSFCVIDLETTGLGANEHRIIEIAIVLFENGIATGSWQRLVHPGRKIPKGSTAIHGITDADVKNAPSFCDLVPEIAGLLHDRIPVAYNASFDRGFLHAEFERAGRPPSAEDVPALRPDVVWIDPLLWVRQLAFHEDGHKLGQVAARMGIAHAQAHRAQADAHATGQILLALAAGIPATYGELVDEQ
jgi:DNA polymerase-3 subunit epsilon